MTGDTGEKVMYKKVSKQRMVRDIDRAREWKMNANTQAYATDKQWRTLHTHVAFQNAAPS